MAKLISRLALPVLLAGLAALAVRRSVLSSFPPVMLAQAGALATAFWARRSFDRGQFRVTEEPAGGVLLDRGPYRVLRHPMYAAALLFVWASVLGHWSPGNAGIGLLVTAVVSVRIVHEERILRQRVPGYAEYCRRTKRLVPYLV
jgi:protein-S-isoprenylcysteine O-methyltransferase Ste14